MRKYPTEVSFLYAERGPHLPIRWASWKHPLNREAEGWLDRELDGFRPYLKRGDVAIDVGAYTGDTTLPMAMLGAEVWAYEPNPATFEVLRQNQLLNPHLSIETICAGLSSSDGLEVHAYSDADQCNGGSEAETKSILVPGYHTSHVHVINANIPLLLNERLSFIKIDAEGSDLRILKAMLPGLRMRQRLPVIQFELFPGSPRADREELLALLDDLSLTPVLGDHPISHDQFLTIPLANVTCLP